VGVILKKNDFLYLRVYEDIKEKILSGVWNEGMKLPPEYELMIIFEVSRDTIRKSLQKLSEDGYIYRQVGAGTFVKNIKSRYKLTVLESFTEQMNNRNLKPSSEIIEILLEKPEKEILHHLELKITDKVYKVVRLRKADNIPMSYEIAYIPYKTCPNLDSHIDENSSLYRIYEDFYGLKLKYGKIYLEAIKCENNMAQKLSIKPGDPILKMNCIVFLDNNKPLYFVESHYVGDKYMFFASMPREL